ncbi:MAG: hypothetical protein FWE91_04125 [Defluviitaleaceae bacterium]|nr:hypothetical protein [Defluviitaleaceae bacterium]MCL2837113.1 hypothetical protein [Defluviitaleaceae bacterium]
MKTLGNMIWFVLFGWWLGTLYMIIGGLFFITILGAPIGLAMFEYAKLMYLPFGKSIVRESFVKGPGNMSPIKKTVQTVLNIIWLPIGIILFLLNFGSMLLCFVSIILIPLGIVQAKALKFLLWPIGAKVVKNELVQAIHTANVLEKRGLVGRGGTQNVNVTVNVPSAPAAPSAPAGSAEPAPIPMPVPDRDEDRRN